MRVLFWVIGFIPAAAAAQTAHPRVTLISESGTDPMVMLLAAVSLVLLVVTGWALMARAAALRALAEATREIKPPGAAPAEPEALPSQQAKAVESTRRDIKELLARLNEFMTQMLEQNAEYAGKLAKHRENTRHSVTREDLEEVQRLLLDEVGQMQENCEGYRSQLAAARVECQTQQRIIEHIRADARVDYVTRLPHRRAFEERAQTEIDGMAAAGEAGSHVSLLMVDVDHFRNVNVKWGPETGDRVLQLVGHVLSEGARPGDFVARYGGEEFVVLMPGATPVQAEVAAKELRRAVAQASLRQESGSVNVTVSIGVVGMKGSEATVLELVQRADAAVAQAKRAGRDRVVLAPPGPSESPESATARDSP